MNAKIPHSNLPIGRSDDAGRRWLCPADSPSKHSGGNDSSGSCSHNSQISHHPDSSYKDGNGNQERDSCSPYNEKR